MRCPNCGETLDEDNYCSECGGFFEDLVNNCPVCGNGLDEDNYCSECGEFFNNDDEEELEDGVDFDVDYESMVNDGSKICLNCTFWSVSPYGKAHGMYCRRGNGQTNPNDTCGEFTQSHSFANYGDNGEFQFDVTSRDISNKLDNWNNRRY